nr:hypothetical protein [Tanacetum cinerariifolium]
ATPNEPGSQGTSSGSDPRCQETIGDTVAQTRSERVSKISNDLLLAGVNTTRSDEAVNEEMNDNLERVTTIVTSLDAEQDRGNIFKTQSKATPNEPGSQGTSSGGGLRCQETIRDTVAQTRKPRRNVTEVPQSSDPIELVADKAINEEMDYSLERAATTATSLDAEHDRGKEDASKQGRIVDIGANEDIYLVNVHNDEDMFGVNDLVGDEVIIESVDVAAQAKEVVDNITLAKSLMEIKSEKPKADKVVIQEPEQGTTTTTPTTITTASSRSKAKGLVIHEQKHAPKLTVSSQQPL